MINLLQAMFSTIWPQPKRQESTQPAVEVVKREGQESASPKETSGVDESVKPNDNRSTTPLDISGDIKRLEDTFLEGHPMERGCIIETTLRELLSVCPRKRKRSDAYRKLINALNEMGVELKISKRNDNRI